MDEPEEEGIEMKKKGSGAALMKRPLLDTSTADAEELPAVAAVQEVLRSSPLPSAPEALLEVAEAAVDPHTGAAVTGAKSSTFRAALNTIKSIVGVGILSFPFAMR
jgi:hypothetical protein